ncbi:hypothetical protein GCM10022240_05720 [Microbacterium kribbense]|uniref:Uncharacterized protein n=1 Tax=Microbacterium kribbense TaxID=433645 RepID=A0ABP7G5U7_9MICO
MFSLGGRTPQMRAHCRVDAVGAHQQRCLKDGAVLQLQFHVIAAVVDADDFLARVQHSVRQSGEHALVQVGAQHPGESPAVFGDDIGRNVDVRADLASYAAECGVAGGAEVIRVHTHQP